MQKQKPEMVRVNTRISHEANEWLDNQSMNTGIPKSTLILLAIENYMREKEAMARMADMGQLVEKLEVIEKELKQQKEK
jgi:Ribbon-helix-helix protein, copG family.